MTEAERNEWRIRAAACMGWRCEQVEVRYAKSKPRNPADRLTEPRTAEYWFHPDHPKLPLPCPNPFANPADCEALLIRASAATCPHILAIQVTSTVAIAGFWPTDDVFRSDNPDPTLAYREAVVQACVLALEGVQNG